MWEQEALCSLFSRSDSSPWTWQDGIHHDTHYCCQLWGDVEGMNTQTRVHYNGPQGAVSVVWLIMSFVVTQGCACLGLCRGDLGAMKRGAQGLLSSPLPSLVRL